MIRQWTSQILAIIRLELKKTFFARRGLWVYLLAFAPVLLFVAHSILAPRAQERLARVATRHPVSVETLRSIKVGAAREDIEKKAGAPYFQRTGKVQTEGVRGDALYKYTDGRSDYYILFEKGKVKSIHRIDPESLSKGSLIFATSFQTYFLRLAIFFGCVGIFVNLFRGEMLDKSLHFYLLTPMRREVLLAGKYLAGLLATVVIFTTSAGLQLTVMLWQFDHAALGDYLAGPGWGHILSYLMVTILACIGYGSVFVAAGMFFRNPIIPTISVLLWEGANVFLPAALKKISLIFYLQSLCPVVAPPDVKLPAVWKLLISTAEPVAPAAAVSGVLIFTLVVLVAAAIRARTLEINYSAD
jgi:ABC-type transport system involved in multi-copper enzyme maturation permease subunit